MRWRELLRRPGRYNPAEDCLAGFTTEEFKAAAAAVDRGDQAPADALVARVGDEHGRCVAFAVLQFTGIDTSEAGR